MPSGHWGIIVACTQEYKNNDGVWSSLILRGIWPPAKVLEVRKEILLTHTILAKQKIILKPLKNPTKLFKKNPKHTTMYSKAWLDNILHWMFPFKKLKTIHKKICVDFYNSFEVFTINQINDSCPVTTK